MQDLSYHFTTAQFALFDLSCEVTVYTFENVYGLDPRSTVVDQKDGLIDIRCGRVLFSGGQESAEANVYIRAWLEDGRVMARVGANSFPEFIRSIKLTVHGVKPGRVLNKLDLKEPEVTERGLLLFYPEAWRTLDTPMVLLGTDKDAEVNCFRSLDDRVRSKRFALLKKGDTLDVELIFEPYGSEVCSSVDAPVWEIGRYPSLEAAYKRQTEHIRKVYKLTEWEKRPDLPEWAKKISLVTAIHGQHWTGYIFNDYEKMLSTLEWFAKRIEPERILAYLPGWEGRYYWQYGDYRPCPRMGGEAGFKRLCDGANEMGVHLMPMFGINIVNRNTKNIEQWGEPSRPCVMTGGLTGGGGVDWDGSRTYDNRYAMAVHPGAPHWQTRLAEQITSLANRYGFQSAFLDIAACWYNDEHFPPMNEAVKSLCDRLRAGTKDMLVAGEGWYDGLSIAMPVIHSGHSDGPMNYNDAIYPPFFDTFMRTFAHLCLGDPGRGSSGVHELGTNFDEWRTPLRKGVWPTVTVVENTLQVATDRVEEIIADAKNYAVKYL